MKNKIDPKAAAKKAEEAKKKLQNSAVGKTATDIFEKMKKTVKGIDNKKIDAWQDKWLTMPGKRKKYEHLIDAPQVAGEELIGMTNDIIDFIQKEETGKSVVFGKLKSQLAEMKKNPKSFFKDKWAKGVSAAKTASEKGKALAEKGVKAAEEAKKHALNKVEGKAEKTAKTAKKVAKK